MLIVSYAEFCNSPIMLSVIKLNAVILSVVAPRSSDFLNQFSLKKIFFEIKDRMLAKQLQQRFLCG
jgi:hypothetical protein